MLGVGGYVGVDVESTELVLDVNSTLSTLKRSTAGNV